MIHLDPSRSVEAVDAGWRAHAERLPGLEAAFRATAATFRAIAVCADSLVIGVLLARDGIIHLGIVPEWRGRWASRRVIREMLQYGTRTEYLPGVDDVEFLNRVRRVACR